MVDEERRPRGKRRTREEQEKPPPREEVVRENVRLSEEEQYSLTELIEMQPDLSEIVDDREARKKIWDYIQRFTKGIVEFLKWSSMIGVVVAATRGVLHGWLK